MLNQLIIIGRLTHDPETKILEDGRKVSDITLAVQRTFKNMDGNYETDFIKVTVWEGLATAIESYCSKGVMVAVKARIQSWKYDLPEDRKLNMLEVIAERISYLSPSGKNDMKVSEESSVKWTFFIDIKCYAIYNISELTVTRWRMKEQVKKGIIEIFVLAILSKGDSYGYKLVNDLINHIEISESTLYPILRRLEKADELKTYSEVYQGRHRKYYQMTEKGREHMDEFLSEWEDIKKIYSILKKWG